jgi:hypothetical protein
VPVLEEQRRLALSLVSGESALSLASHSHPFFKPLLSSKAASVVCPVSRVSSGVQGPRTRNVTPASVAFCFLAVFGRL